MSLAVSSQAGAAGSASERIHGLLDPGSFYPLRAGVGDGVLAGAGQVSGRPVFAWAQEAERHAGALGSAGGETIAHTIRRASASGAPVIGFPHSAGARLQEGARALGAYAAIFRAQALAGVPQLSVVAGPCAGGAAYSPALGDFVLMTGPEALMFLTGPGVVEQVTRERLAASELGGARVHRSNGVAHLVADDDAHATELTRSLLGHLPQRLRGPLPLAPPRPPGRGDPGDVLPPRRREVYDVRDVVARIVDAGALLELSSRWARNLVCGLARLEGSPVAVLANQPRYLGGTIDAAGAQKGAWFVSLCDRLGLPLLVFVDTPGFLPGATQEQEGVIRHGAAFLRAFGTATVPRITVTLRQAYGGAHIVMNSRDLGADHTLAWRGALIGVMGARQAVSLIERRAVAGGADPARLAERYAADHLPAERAAAAGLVDEVVAPADTRRRLLAVLGHRT